MSSHPIPYVHVQFQSNGIPRELIEADHDVAGIKKLMGLFLVSRALAADALVMNPDDRTESKLFMVRRDTKLMRGALATFRRNPKGNGYEFFTLTMSNYARTIQTCVIHNLACMAEVVNNPETYFTDGVPNYVTTSIAEFENERFGEKGVPKYFWKSLQDMLTRAAPKSYDISDRSFQADIVERPPYVNEEPEESHPLNLRAFLSKKTVKDEQQ